MARTVIFILGISVLLFSCNTISKNYSPDKKYSRLALQEDYTLLQNILQKKHPSLYWYTAKDSMDIYFDKYYQEIADSMTELQFGWQVLAPLTNKVHCGHTSFGMSKGWNKFMWNTKIPSFPLFLKVWGDTMVVTANLNRKDSVIRRGMQITSINGIRNKDLIPKIFDLLPLDGYAENVNYVRISSNFPYYHRNTFGIYKNYRVGYIDSSGTERTVLLPLFVPEIDTSKAKKVKEKDTISHREFRKQRIESYRSLTIDTTINTGIMMLNSFNKGGGKRLRSFFRRSFNKMNDEGVKNLILDLRFNGGGDIGLSVLLTKYLRNTPFKVADTTYAVTKSLGRYTKYVKQGFFNNIGLFFLTRKRADGNYHYGYWERHWFKPKSRNHFNGNVYILINGPTFSASTLFCNAVKGQENIKLVGEEAGGGWYGNNGIMIPDIVLPNTKLKVRLPLFRIVQFDHVEKDGRGVMPDIFIPTSIEAIRKGVDKKMEEVKQIIRATAVNESPAGTLQ